MMIEWELLDYALTRLNQMDREQMLPEDATAMSEVCLALRVLSQQRDRRMPEAKDVSDQLVLALKQQVERLERATAKLTEAQQP